MIQTVILIPDTIRANHSKKCYDFIARDEKKKYIVY